MIYKSTLNSFGLYLWLHISLVCRGEKNCELLEGAYVNYSGLHFVIVNLLVQFKFHFEQCLKEPHYNFLVLFAILVFLT